MVDNDLAPYCSFILLRQRSGRKPATSDEILQACTDALGVKAAFGDRQHADKGSVREKGGSVIGRWATYIQFKAPGWTTPAFADSAGKDALNRLHHIVAVVVTGHSVAVHLSDSSERLVLERQLGVAPGLEELRPVPPAHLGNAFALDNTRTLWLSSTMLSVASRADTKVLAGPDLDAALDPLGDQTYAYTSARWRSRDKLRTHGVTPRRSQVWTGPSSSLDAFASTALTTLKLLNTKTSNLEDPLPILARDAPLGDAKKAFDVGFIPDAATEGDADEVSWRETVTFDTAPRGKHDALVDVTVDGVDVGRLSLKVKADRLGVSVTPTIEGSPNDKKLLNRVAAACKQRNAIRISYGTGHVVSGGAVLTSTLTDAPFEAWEPADLKGFDRHKEKPTKQITDKNDDIRRVADLDQIGAQDSLFCWAAAAFAKPGVWLTCDDGSGEIADFVRLELAASGALELDLIHIKAASKPGKTAKGATTTSISASDYEIVLSQALKNLRWLETTSLVKGLSRATAAGAYTTYAKASTTRAAMVAALKAHSGPVQRRVVVVQPRVTMAALAANRAALGAGATGPDPLRLRQLDTLLHAANAECRKLGATLRIYGAA